MHHTLIDHLAAYIQHRGITAKDLRRAQDAIHSNYEQHKNSRTFKDPLLITAYAVTRMPATYAAITHVLNQIPAEFVPESWLDLGAGPATATLASFARWPSAPRAVLVEQHALMQDIGRALLTATALDARGSYHQQTIEAYPDATPHDLVVLSYVLSELTPEEQQRVVAKAWGLTRRLCVIVTPGTPFAYRSLMAARRQLLAQGAHIMAPCPHAQACPLEGSNDTWCHFAVRLERSRLHQYAKQASLNYEDEKFSYQIFSKQPTTSHYARVIRRPLQRQGHVILDLCQHEGIIRQTVSKKTKERYRQATKLQWGDAWDLA